MIFYLDKDNYQYSMITGLNRDYFWILSRISTVPKSTKNRLLPEVKNRGLIQIRLLILVECFQRNKPNRD